MAGKFTLPANGDRYEWDKLFQIGAAANGLSGWGRIWNLVSLDDDSNYLLTLRNLGSGGHVKVLRSTDGAALLTMTDSGLTVTDVTITGGLTVNGALSVKGNASIGDAAGDAHVIKGTVNVQHAADFDSTVNVDGAVTLGTTLNVTGATTLADLTVGGNVTVTGTGRTIKADWSNGTIANRVTFETSTATASTLMQMRPSNGGTAAGWNIYNTNGLTGQRLQLAITSTTGILAVESTGGGALPLGFYTNGSLQAQLSTAGVFYAQNLIAGATALIGTEKLYVAGNALLSNTSYLNGLNAGGTAVNLLRINGSDIIESGQTGTRHNLLGTVVAPDIDPPTVNGQVTQRAVAAAWAYFTVAGGAVTLRDSYNVTSVTYNAAGDYTVTWDRDFSSAYYACLPSVEDNGAVLLAPKVNSQAAGSADIWVYNVAAAKTDPDAVSVVCFGTLS